MSGDWDALAHVRLLREGGGPSSGYTADLIDRMWRQRASARMAMQTVITALEELNAADLEIGLAMMKNSVRFIQEDYGNERNMGKVGESDGVELGKGTD